MSDQGTDVFSDLQSDPKQLLKLAQYRMPFGKYANRLLIDLPEPYVIWFANKGFPHGELGIMLGIVYEIIISLYTHILVETNRFTCQDSKKHPSKQLIHLHLITNY